LISSNNLIICAKAEIEQIVSSTEEPNLKNTIEALDYSGEEFEILQSQKNFLIGV
jgi:Zn-dependent oligopeptidase